MTLHLENKELMETIYYTHLESPIGKLLLAGTDSTLQWVGFPTGKQLKTPETHWVESDSPFQAVIQQLLDYFDGTRQTFALPLGAQGTPFQKKVWQALLEIPYGKTVTYGEIAQKIGQPKASRAVGAANGQNPIPIIIPCHRVIGKSGDLTGFGGGLALKEKLLSLEQGVISPQTRFVLPAESAH